MNTAVDPSDFGDYLISARSFDEYRAMFTLTEKDIRGAVLDCPGGGSSFTAHAASAGTDAVAADPAYATAAAELASLVLTETHRGSAWATAGGDRYEWDYFADVDGHQRVRQAAAAVFAADLLAHPERYVAAALPTLPFPDRRFDLVLSSHLLFTYADRLDDAFHLNALLEMHRVSSGEVRVFPLLDNGGNRHDQLLDMLRGELTNRGINTEVRDADYQFQRGGNRMLIVRPMGTSAPVPPPGM